MNLPLRFVLLTFIATMLANYTYQAFTTHNWWLASERTFFQAAMVSNLLMFNFLYRRF